MDIIRFTNPTSPTKMEQAVFVSDLKSKLWVERYREAGEFTLIGDARSDLQKQLPIGSFISHMNTYELMIVENHEISTGRNKNPELTITGRGFETFLENRIVGSNKVFPVSDGSQDYALPLAAIWDQAVSLVKDHIDTAMLIDDNNGLLYVDVEQSLGAGAGIERSVKSGNVYEVLVQLLAVMDLGIRVLRPTFFLASPYQSGVNTTFLIHQGAARQNLVSFSSDTSSVDSADYLWSNKTLKNSALVVGRWVQLMVNTVGAVQYDRRTMTVDASDIDNNFGDAPVGSDLDGVVAAMTARGNAAIAVKNDIALSKVEFSPNAKDTVYRRDFEVGDTVTVLDDFHETTTMRITEYAEIDDENGSSGHPTLALI